MPRRNSGKTWMASPSVFTGFLYKFIVAASIKSYWIDHLVGDGFLSTLSYLYGYSLYLYFDFAGYTPSPSGSATCWGFGLLKTSTAPFWPPTSRTSGTAGTLASPRGFAIMCT